MIEFPRTCTSVEDILPLEAFSTTSSCGSGTREVHLAATDQAEPEVESLVWVAGVVTVMPVFPSLSPTTPPVIPQEPAPAAVMSLKSALVIEVVAAVIVRAVPSVLDDSSTLFTAELPVIVSVPDIVMFPEKL